MRFRLKSVGIHVADSSSHLHVIPIYNSLMKSRFGCHRHIEIRTINLIEVWSAIIADRMSDVLLLVSVEFSYFRKFI